MWRDYSLLPDGFLGPGLYALWIKVRDIQIDIINAHQVHFVHEDLNLNAKSQNVDNELNISTVEPGCAGVYFQDGAYVETLGPGRYMFWKNQDFIRPAEADSKCRSNWTH